MYVAHLVLQDFRSYGAVDIPLEPGVSVFVGPNGHGKTNLVEALGYVATLGSHRASTDTPLVRHGSDRGVVRAKIVRDGQGALVEIEINPGQQNRARLNRSPVQRTREVLGALRTVLFAPEDLALVRGDPGERRRFLDDLLVVRAPRFAAVRGDYERVLKQRTALLKSASGGRGAGSGSAIKSGATGGSGSASGTGNAGMLRTLEVWDAHLAEAGARLLAARMELVAALRPLVAKAYAALAPSRAVELDYRCTAGDVAELAADPQALDTAMRDSLIDARNSEIERGVCLIGPHRDDLAITLGELPARGYASQGEAWSLGLALRLASYELLRADGDDPVLVLDDVFSELDTDRRTRLAELVAPAEQVLVTAAVGADVPETLSGANFDVVDGEVRRVR